MAEEQKQPIQPIHFSHYILINARAIEVGRAPFSIEIVLFYVFFVSIKIIDGKLKRTDRHRHTLVSNVYAFLRACYPPAQLALYMP